MVECSGVEWSGVEWSGVEWLVLGSMEAVRADASYLITVLNHGWINGWTHLLWGMGRDNHGTQWRVGSQL
jgi:hypothetical protein